MKVASILFVVALAACGKSNDKKIQEIRRLEATMYLQSMSNAARTYYATPTISGEIGSVDAKINPRQLPPSVGPTPPLGTCCKDGGKCKPSAVWSQPAWTALNFEITEPHSYSFEFKSIKKGEEEGYTAIAYGDLDCDGEYSTFSLSGTVVGDEIEVASDIIELKALE